MRFGIQTWGTEGDIRPFFALGSALRARGHDVHVLYTNIEGRDYGKLAAACGLEATACGGAYFEANRARLAENAKKAFADWNQLRQIRAILDDLMDPVAPEMVDAGVALGARSDVMISHFMAYPAHVAAEKSGRPHVIVGLVPMFPSSAYPPIGMPSLGRWTNRLGWSIVQRFFDSVFRPRVAAQRARLGLPPQTPSLDGSLEHALLALVAVSPSLFPRPDDWGPRADVCGFLSLPETAEPWTPEPPLAAFLDGGPPPAFLSFGSMFSLDAARTAATVDALGEAVALAGVRGIIQAPESIVAAAKARPNVRHIVRAPHARLFPRCSMIVHHGGAGTTQSALLAGRPSIVVPHAADQFYWGDVLERRGAAVKQLRATALTPAKLAARIREVVARPDLAARAGELGRALAAEDGATLAATKIEAALR